MPKMPRAHPYIPNSVADVKRAMLEAIGARSIEEIYAGVPDSLRMKRPLNLPEPITAEAELRSHVDGILKRNRSCCELTSFLGNGCYQHHVPAICDEVNSRAEFLTAYAGEPYDDHGRFQALFEYCSMMGELLAMDVVNVPVYDGWQAAATSIRMAARVTGRSKAVIAGPVNPDKLAMINTYCRSDISLCVGAVPPHACDSSLLGRLDEDTACVYLENPGWLGIVDDPTELIEAAHKAGALAVVAADPLSLGVLEPPAAQGADIVCGDIQGLGNHMSFGGGHGGFIACHDVKEIVMEIPSRLFGIAPTAVPGEYGFGDVAYGRTSFANREKGREWVGTAGALNGITAGVFLATVGPEGLAELGVTLMERSRAAAVRLDRLPGVGALWLDRPFFKEFVIRFDSGAGTVRQISAALLERGILLGSDLSAALPELGQCALLCTTEIHGDQEIDALVEGVRRCL